MALRLITAPASITVPLEEMKAYLSVEDDDFDAEIEAFTAAAVAYLDGPTGLLQLALEPQTWEWSFDTFPGCAVRWDATWQQPWVPSQTIIEVPLKKLIEVESIKYDDADGVEQTLDPANYVVDTASVPGRIAFVQNFVAPVTQTGGLNAVRIRFTAGYLEDEPPSGQSGETTSTVPNPIKIAIKMMVADMFENRETVSNVQTFSIPVSATVEMLLRPFRPHIIA